MAKKIRVKIKRNNWDRSLGKSIADGPSYMSGQVVEVDQDQIKRWDASTAKHGKKFYELEKEEVTNG